MILKREELIKLELSQVQKILKDKEQVLEQVIHKLKQIPNAFELTLQYYDLKEDIDILEDVENDLIIYELF